MPHDGTQLFSTDRVRQRRQQSARSAAKEIRDTRLADSREQASVQCEAAAEAKRLDEVLADAYDVSSLIAAAEAEAQGETETPWDSPGEN